MRLLLLVFITIMFSSCVDEYDVAIDEPVIIIGIAQPLYKEYAYYIRSQSPNVHIKTINDTMYKNYNVCILYTDSIRYIGEDITYKINANDIIGECECRYLTIK